MRLTAYIIDCPIPRREQRFQRAIVVARIHFNVCLFSKSLERKIICIYIYTDVFMDLVALG